MKKSIAIVIVGILVISGLGAVALPQNNEIMTQSATWSISDHSIVEQEQYITVSLDEATGTLMETGKPMIPVFVKSFTFPLGTKINDISVQFNTNEVNLDKKIQPSPQPVPLNPEYASEILSQEQIIDDTIYSSTDLYPVDTFEVSEHAGMINGENVLIVNVQCNAQYSSGNDVIYIPEDIKIDITYNPPDEPLLAADEFDLLIITDESFVSGLQPLVDHKNSIGVKTVVDTVQNIYSSYNGRDEPEDIKLRIKDALDEWGIDFVLLAGGRDGQSMNWIVPPRRVFNDDGWESGYDSDLYYADIYKIVDGELVFEDWDSSGNDKIGEWSNFVGKKDLMDYYPDVSVGRLPIRKSSQIDAAIQKIIDYENNADDSWYKTGVVISGDTFPPSRGGSPGWWEGEMETQQTVDMLESIGFTMKKLWLSIPGAWEDTSDVINAFSAGAGFVHFAGHSNPASWGNHPPDDTEHIFIDGIKMWEIREMTNKGEYPVVVLGGCHSAQYNVTLSHIIEGIKEYGINGYFFGPPFRFFYYEWVPFDLSSGLVMQKDAGAIASMGNTGLGYGYVNQHADAGLGGWIEPRFFDAYVNQSLNTVGEAHAKAIADYITFVGGVNSDQIDRKCIEEWVLLGDPSVQMGGI